MASLTEKRKLATEWINTAEEVEIDALLESVFQSQNAGYSPDLIQQLDDRWENYISGKKMFTTPEALREKLLRK